MKSFVIAFLVIMALFFNAGLALVHQHILPLNSLHVMLLEGVLLVMSLGLGVSAKLMGIRYWLAVSGIFISINLTLSLLNQAFYPKPLRDILVLAAFLILGMAYRPSNLPMLMRWICMAVLVGLLLEAWTPETYVNLFNPAGYYLATRGIGEALPDAAVFTNALSYEGRFPFEESFAISEYRLGSLFLEQVTLGNFGVVLAIFTSAFWAKLCWRERSFFAGSILLIMAGTHSRLALGMSVIILAGHFFFVKLPRFIPLIYMPTALLFGYLLFYPGPGIFEDTLSGRIAWTYTLFAQMNLSDLMGLNPDYLSRTMDSGYAYVLYGQSLFGLIALWLAAGLLPQPTPEAKRLVHGLNLFLALSLLVSTSIFSIKTGALLWFMAGYACWQKKPKSVSV